MMMDAILMPDNFDISKNAKEMQLSVFINNKKMSIPAYIDVDGFIKIDLMNIFHSKKYRKTSKQIIDELCNNHIVDGWHIFIPVLLNLEAYCKYIQKMSKQCLT